MAGDSDYAQKQFLVTKAEQSKAAQVDAELRLLRRKVKLLEDKVSSLSTELSRRNVIGEIQRGFS